MFNVILFPMSISYQTNNQIREWNLCFVKSGTMDSWRVILKKLSVMDQYNILLSFL